MSPDEPKTTFAVTKKVSFLVKYAISKKNMDTAIVTMTINIISVRNTLIINYLN